MAAPAAVEHVTGLPPISTLTSGETQLEYLCRNTQACVLRPYCFFVSWQGVLTLAYRGFPQPLVQLKQQVTDFYQGLPKESPGSKWPKTSLACLRECQRLTPAQLQRLNELCREHSGIFQTPGHKRAQSVLVNNLSTLVYETRCCERVISRKVVQLAMPVDLAEPQPEEAERVQTVVAEADDADYWFHASRDGNREKHYRTAALGVTLVHELGLGQQPLSATAAAAGSTPTHTRSNSSSSLGNSSSADGAAAAAAAPGTAAVAGQSTAAWASALPGIISKFRGAIQTEFPELYAWFDDASLHVTVRAIIV